MIGAVEDFLDLFFMGRCQVCKRISEKIICPLCLKTINFVEPPVCQACGKPLKNDRKLCPMCEVEKPPYSICRSVIYYDAAARQAIVNLKFKRNLKLVEPLACYLVEFLEKNIYLMNPDILVPVPGASYGEDRIEAAREFCRVTAKKLKLNTVDALETNRLIKPQYNLGIRDRWENVRDAFVVRSSSEIQDKTILLIDDIFTTGATVSNCSRALIQAGAKKVNVLTLSRAIGKNTGK